MALGECAPGNLYLIAPTPPLPIGDPKPIVPPHPPYCPLFPPAGVPLQGTPTLLLPSFRILLLLPRNLHPTDLQGLPFYTSWGPLPHCSELTEGVREGCAGMSKMGDVLGSRG